MNEEPEVFYSTKYALTQGIKKMTGKRQGIHAGDRREYVYLDANHYHNGMQHIVGVTAFHTEAEAVKRAKEMRNRKIVSLKKSINKLEKMRFEVS